MMTEINDAESQTGQRQRGPVPAPHDESINVRQPDGQENIGYAQQEILQIEAVLGRVDDEFVHHQGRPTDDLQRPVNPGFRHFVFPNGLVFNW